MIQDAIHALIERGTISGEEAAAAIEQMMAGEATTAQIGAFLTALRIRGETPEVLSACLGVIEAHAEAVPAADVVDIVGTGGDGVDTFNVSTAAALVVAGCGVRVAKHGNRAASSKCGSADVLEALGARLELDGAHAARVVDGAGFCFLFAQRFHPAFRHVGPARREIAIRTIFNVLGPMANPARPRAMLVGAGVASVAPLLAETLRIRGMRRAMVVHSAEGMDEISPAGPTAAWIVEGGHVREQELLPADFGLQAHPLPDVLGGDAAANAVTLRAVLAGEQGPMTDFVLMNAGAALVVAEAATDFRAGVVMARKAIADGRAANVLDDYVRLSNEGSSG
ncbi:MAG: anthranilate phosphoribosyltransferase [Dehalococcoidia bacterium]|nr:anthranilate phosphoribosyltransferase [Dehalococcoidia bacterium]